MKKTTTKKVENQKNENKYDFFLNLLNSSELKSLCIKLMKSIDEL
jgi:hypothetical protein